MTKTNRLEVSREEAISFCESALRNIGSLHLCADDIDDIAGALTIFRKKAIETNTRTGDTARCPLQGCVLLQPHTHDPADRSKITLAALSAPQSITPPELVERVARALFADQWLDDDGRTPILWEDAAPIEQEAWKRSACAAIAALSTPEASDTKLVDALERIDQFITQYREPWGSWKTAWWEGEVSDDAAFTDDNAIMHCANIVRKALAQHRGSTL